MLSNKYICYIAIMPAKPQSKTISQLIIGVHYAWYLCTFKTICIVAFKPLFIWLHFCRLFFCFGIFFLLLLLVYLRLLLFFLCYFVFVSMQFAPLILYHFPFKSDLIENNVIMQHFLCLHVEFNIVLFSSLVSRRFFNAIDRKWFLCELFDLNQNIWFFWETGFFSNFGKISKWIHFYLFTNL